MDLSKIYQDNRIKEVRGVKEKQINLEGCKLGEHKFTGLFSVPAGLAHQCCNCGFTEHGKIVDGIFLINPPLDEKGFLDRSKL